MADTKHSADWNSGWDEAAKLFDDKTLEVRSKNITDMQKRNRELREAGVYDRQLATERNKAWGIITKPVSALYGSGGVGGGVGKYARRAARNGGSVSAYGSDGPKVTDLSGDPLAVSLGGTFGDNTRAVAPADPSKHYNDKDFQKEWMKSQMSALGFDYDPEASFKAQPLGYGQALRVAKANWSKNVSEWKKKTSGAKGFSVPFKTQGGSDSGAASAKPETEKPGAGKPSAEEPSAEKPQAEKPDPVAIQTPDKSGFQEVSDPTRESEKGEIMRGASGKSGPKLPGWVYFGHPGNTEARRDAAKGIARVEGYKTDAPSLASAEYSSNPKFGRVTYEGVSPNPHSGRRDALRPMQSGVAATPTRPVQSDADILGSYQKERGLV